MDKQFAQMDAALTAVAVDYKAPDLIGNEIAPVTKVPGTEFKYPKWGKKSQFIVPNTALSDKGEYPEIEFSKDLVPGAVTDRGLSTFVSQKTIELEETAGNNVFLESITEKTVRAMQRRKEVQIARMAQDAANYKSNVKTYAATNSWNNEKCDPIQEIADTIANSLISFNRLWVARDAFNALIKNPNVTAYWAGKGENIFVTSDMIAQLLGLEKVVIGKANYDVSDKEDTVTIQNAWTANAGLYLYDVPAAASMAQTFMFDGYWMPEGYIRDVWQMPILDRGRRGGVKVLVGESSDVFCTSEDYGYLFKNVTAK